jgi:hypothetical protein
MTGARRSTRSQVDVSVAVSIKFSHSFFYHLLLPMFSLTRTRPLSSVRKICRAVSTWSNVPAGPPDPILGMFHASNTRGGRGCS